MLKSTKSIRRMGAIAGLLVLGAMASAFTLDAQILIDRALNSPTLTIRYSGANAALVELRVNGQSIGTRSVSATKTSGETNFTIDLSSLKDGDNEVEIRLFDRTGKLVGKDKTNISTEQGNAGPVFLAAPKVGATVMGPVEIKVGFGRELRNSYVSFFVNEQFKSMTNYPPYTFLWDTTRENNGWHEVEAWVVDETSQTYKTRKIRVFVNNPGGRTDRVGVTAPKVDLTPSTPAVRTGVVGAPAGVRTIGKTAAPTAAGAAIRNAAPVVSGTVLANKVRAGQIGVPSGIKPLPPAKVAMTDVRNLTPTGVRVAVSVPKAPVASVSSDAIKVSAPALTRATTPNTVAQIRVEAPKAVAPVVSKTAPVVTVPKTNVVTPVSTLIPVTKGQRIPNLASFAVVLNSQVVRFDVQPRVDDGVPMTPFRHLIEKAGGKVDWENMTKSVQASADGRTILLQIGDGTAKIDEVSVTLEVAPYLDRGRTIVPLSFIREALNVNVEFDKKTGHVLITSLK